MHVLIICPLHAGFLYVAAAAELNATVSVLTTDTNDYVVPEEYRKSVNLVRIASFEQSVILEAAKKLHQQQPLDGVIAGVEFLVAETAFVAEQLGLPGLNAEHAAQVRNKAQMREVLQANNLRSPRFAKVFLATELEKAAETVGFPAVVKPVNMAGSFGVVRVDDMTNLLAAYEDIVTDKDGLFDHKASKEVLIEEMLIGTEYCVDGYVTQDGTITAFEFVKVELGQQPYFQEIGYTVYRPEDLDCASALAEYITEVVKAMGITIGPFHSEVMLTKDGPVLIEIAARLPGDRLPIMSEQATGISFATCALAATLGMPIPEPKTSLGRIAASQFILDTSHIGEQFEGLSNWDEIKAHPQVTYAAYDVQPGSVIPPFMDCRSRVAQVCYTADSPEKAEEFRVYIQDTLKVLA
jgi:biotin carboxylase